MMNTPDEMITAVYRKDYAVLETLLASADSDARDADGRTLLMHAILASDADHQMVDYLIQRGANVNAVDQDQRWSALHFAARDQKTRIVKALLDSGADVEAVDVHGNTPLWRGVMNNSPNFEIIEQLLAGGADPDRKNNYGVSPKDTVRKMDNADLLALLDRWKAQGPNR